MLPNQELFLWRVNVFCNASCAGEGLSGDIVVLMQYSGRQGNGDAMNIKVQELRYTAVNTHSIVAARVGL